MTRLRRLVTPALARCAGRAGYRDASTRASEDGFTLIEVVIAIGLSAVVFLALAMAMAGGFKAVAVAKARTRGNEVTTAAIEDLQRFDYDHLGLCPASGSAVTDPGTQSFQGLSPVTLNCGSSAVLEAPDGGNWTGSIAGGTPGEQPFGAGTQYVVFRELRQSDGKANASIYTPAISFGSQTGVPTITGVAPSSVDIDPGGLLNADINISATTTGITTSDSVLVTFTSQAGAVTLALQPTDSSGNHWTGTIPKSGGN